MRKCWHICAVLRRQPPLRGSSFRFCGSGTCFASVELRKRCKRLGESMRLDTSHKTHHGIRSLLRRHWKSLLLSPLLVCGVVLGVYSSCGAPGQLGSFHDSSLGRPAESFGAHTPQTLYLAAINDLHGHVLPISPMRERSFPWRLPSRRFGDTFRLFENTPCGDAEPCGSV